MKFSCGKISQYSCRRWDSTLKYIKWQNSFEYWKHLWYRLALKLGWLTDPKVLIKSSRRFLWSLLCRETFRISKTEFVVSSFSLTIFLYAVSKQMNKSLHTMANSKVVLLERHKWNKPANLKTSVPQMFDKKIHYWLDLIHIRVSSLKLCSMKDLSDCNWNHLKEEKKSQSK